jgi:hypothetical protein
MLKINMCKRVEFRESWIFSELIYTYAEPQNTTRKDPWKNCGATWKLIMNVNMYMIINVLEYKSLTAESVNFSKIWESQIFESVNFSWIWALTLKAWTFQKAGSANFQKRSWSDLTVKS